MSLAFVEPEVRAFLTRAEPEILCIRGKWGIGKTYGWNRLLANAASKKEINQAHYSYTSLFGQDSLEQVKLAIFENTLPSEKAGQAPDLETFAGLLDSRTGVWRRLPKIASSLPIMKNFTSVELTSTLSFLAVRNQLVCLDDLERKGKNLRLTDVFGLASFLKEQRKCKVAILLNDEQLGDELEDFERHLEKVVDRSLRYDPTSAESVAIALSGQNGILQATAKRCEALGIQNIRVIRRIDRLIRDVTPILVNFRQEVKDQATSTIALFAWSVLQPDDAPSIDYLTQQRNSVLPSAKKQEENPRYSSWEALLDEYGFSRTDEFDLELLNGIRDGYFRTDLVLKHGAAANERAIAAAADGSFDLAWRRYHDSFDNDQDVVLDGIYTAFKASYRFITPLNLDGTVRLLKELGRPEQATELISIYVDGRNEPRPFFDLDQYAFAGEMKDSDVRAAFKKKHESMAQPPDVRSMLLSLKEGWSDHTIAILADLSVVEYHDILKTTQGRDLRRILSGALQFEGISNASPGMKEISKRMRSALASIGSESPINARRVARYGIEVKPGKG